MQALARLISIIGHPLLFAPIVLLSHGVLTKKGKQGLEEVSNLYLTGFLAYLGLTILIMGYSYFKVQNGSWSHIDASNRKERSSLNLLLMILFWALTLVSIWHEGWSSFTLGVLIAALIVTIALILQQWVKLSLHVAFGTCVAFIYWSYPVIFVGLCFAVILIAWSRLYLKRHNLLDIIVGATVAIAVTTAVTSV